MVLQPRDEALLRMLSRYGVLSTRQLSRFLFPGISHTTVMRRLRLLEQNKFIVRIKGLDEGLSAWRTSSAGAKAIGADPPFRYSNQNQTVHDVTLSEARIRLESHGYADDWTGEPVLKRQQGATHFRSQTTERVIPDGVFIALYRGRPKIIAVELELHAKAKARYEKLLKQYATKTAIDFIWYVVRAPSIGMLLLDTWREIPSYLKSANAPVIGFTVLSELLEDPAKMRLIQAGGSPPVRFFDVFRPLGGVPENGQPAVPVVTAAPAQTPAQSVSSGIEQSA